MLNQLQTLEQTVLELKKQHNYTATELANLKHKMANDDSPHIITDLQNRLAQATQDLNAQAKQSEQLEQSRNALQAQIETLIEENQSLIKQNQELKDKNALAISRAEIIQEWLSKIDKQA
ncbi:hypothetical protein B0181_01460 [Moraxella caviae]|uniref:Uncharacterized protein n=1 Tax=Moraxella caviae TaxID=34060 RepID=A0A1T0AAS6_9GAMM|nr:hypothetical protein [Moraxella caviae]OOR92827.1 hypothetical protein B0181_01460 [Moraxella caviae]STZ14133.1 Uncharacterised protein [Moraxella caviae]